MRISSYLKSTLGNGLRHGLNTADSRLVDQTNEVEGAGALEPSERVAYNHKWCTNLLRTNGTNNNLEASAASGTVNSNKFLPFLF